MMKKWKHPFFGKVIHEGLYGKFTMASDEGFYGYRIGARHNKFPYYIRIHRDSDRFINVRKIIKMRTKK